MPKKPDKIPCRSHNRVMQFRLDGNQERQLHAIEAASGPLKGQPHRAGCDAGARLGPGGAASGVLDRPPTIQPL